MPNLFFRTNVTPYRIDTYNALHRKMGFEFYFLYKEDSSQQFDMQSLYNQCAFVPRFLKSIPVFSRKQRLCINIWRIIQKENPEMIIVPEFKILTIQVLLCRWILRKKFKLICMTDDSYNNLVGKTATNLHLWAQRILASSMDNFLLVDLKVVDWYHRKYGRGIWLPIIRDEEREQPLYKKTLPISREFVKKFDIANKKILLYLSRLEPVKNVKRMIDAISKTEEKYTTVIVGSGSLEDKLRKQASLIDKPIIFTGRYEGDAVRAWYNIADVFILPSTWEPFGAVTNEALIAGCKCLISQNAGSACLINDQNGKVIDPYDVDGMARIIDDTMKDIEIRNELAPRSSNMLFSFDETINRVIKEL